MNAAAETAGAQLAPDDHLQDDHARDDVRQTVRLRLLLIEDDPAHAKLIVRYLERAGKRLPEFGLQWRHCDNGTEGWECVEQAPRAWDLVLLDLNLPDIDGLEVLRRIKQHDEGRVTPVAVFTTSDSLPDRRQAYQAGANSYLVKPVHADRFRELICHLVHYWAVHNRPPP